VRFPALRCRALDPFALTPSAADEQHGDGKHGAEGANSIGCMLLGEQSVDVPALASLRNTGADERLCFRFSF
jgi:hypothetical protein